MCDLAKGLCLTRCQWPATPTRGLSCWACPFSWGGVLRAPPMGGFNVASQSQGQWEHLSACLPSLGAQERSGRTGERSWCFPSPKTGT